MKLSQIASPIFLVGRRAMPLTPVAEIFSDLIQRAALNHGAHDT